MYLFAVFSYLLFAPTVIQAGSSEFQKYPAEAALRHPPAKVQLDTLKARRMRTVLREAAKAPPNFNGHYRVVHWGCGTNCIEWAVVDLATGKVWFAPEPAFSCWVVDEASQSPAVEWFAAHVDSSLLYLHQCTRRRFDRVFDTRYVYVWAGGAGGTLKLIRVEQLAN
jgi:hypothetical protein